MEASSDEELLAGWRAGDAKQGELLWRRHSRSVLRFFRNKVPWSVAADLAQRTLECCVRTQQPIRRVRSYLLGIAKHQLYDYLRSEYRKQQREVDLDTFVIDDMVATPERWFPPSKRDKRVLLQALRRLPLPVQIVLELQYWEQMPVSEIAEVLTMPLGTVKTRIASGHVKLRAAVEQLARSPEQLQSTLDSLDKWASRTGSCAARAETTAR